MSTVKTNNVQVGQSVTATNNATWYQPATPDGTVRLGVGNAGATTADVITASSTGVTIPSVSSNNTFGFKNRIINGGMMIDQRNAGAAISAPTSGQYTVDRWWYGSTQSAKFSFQQNAGSVTPPAGFTNYAGLTSSSSYSVLSSDIFFYQQSIEGYNLADMAFGTANAKTFTLSFWVRSSLTGTFGGAVTNGTQDYCYPFTYSISSANTWTYCAVTISGPTSGSWNTTTGVGMQVQFGLGGGSGRSGTAGAWTTSGVYTATGATSIVGTNGATFYITGVQLEVGSQATSFDFRSYGQELALCQRYYALVNNMPGFGQPGSNTIANGTIQFPVAMRTSPSIGLTGAATISDASADYSQSSANISIVIGTRVTSMTANVTLGNFTGLTAFRPIYLICTSANITASAEL